jgi:hypothetical protein
MNAVAGGKATAEGKFIAFLFLAILAAAYVSSSYGSLFEKKFVFLYDSETDV